LLRALAALAIALLAPLLATAPSSAAAPSDIDLCARVAKQAGFTGEPLVISVAIAMAESSCRLDATHVNVDGTVDRGLWQINSVHDEIFDEARLLTDAQANADAAHYLYVRRNHTFKDWTTYIHDQYLGFMAQARAAVERLTPTPPPEPIVVNSMAPPSANRDLNGDGRDDVFWYAPGSGADSVWRGGTTPGSFATVPEAVNGEHFSPVTGDFNNDGLGDVYFMANNTRTDAIWFGKPGGGWTKSHPYNADGTRLESDSFYFPMAGDFNGDGFDDVFLYGPGAAQDRIWLGTSGQGRFYVQIVSVGGNYGPAVGDFDGNGSDDILWHGPGDRPDSVWWTDRKGGTITWTSQHHTVAGNYLPLGGDFDGNGRDDVYWYAIGSTQDKIWMFGTDRTYQSLGPLNAAGNATVDNEGWHLPFVGDFDGDDHADIFWYGPTSSLGDEVWYGDGGRRFQSALPSQISGTYLPA
jgi:hypothetical protein